MRIKRRKDIELPKLAKSHTERDDPNRAKLLIDTEDPKCPMSRIESAELRHASPNSENEEPTRAKLLSDSEEPRWPKPITDTAAPRRAKLRNDTDDPR
jgi:hypothetical protein